MGFFIPIALHLISGICIMPENKMNNVNSSYQQLISVFHESEIQEGARDFHELLGYISAISASPQPLEIHEWLPDLWRQGVQPSFSTEKLASDFASAVLGFYEDCLTNYHLNQPLDLPVISWLDQSEGVSGEGIAFASGYLFAFDSIEEYWQALNLPEDSESNQLLQTSMLLLSKMATPNVVEPEMEALFNQLPAMTEIVAVLPRLLATLGYFSVSVKSHD